MSTTKYIKKFIWKEPKKKNNKKSIPNETSFINCPSSELLYSVFKNEHEELLKSINSLCRKSQIYYIINIFLIIASSFLFTLTHINSTSSSWVYLALLSISIVLMFFTFLSTIYSILTYKKIIHYYTPKNISIDSFHIRDTEEEEEKIHRQLITSYKETISYNTKIKENLYRESEKIIFSTIYIIFSICCFVILTMIYNFNI